jgi:hypothetical protein
MGRIGFQPELATLVITQISFLREFFLIPDPHDFTLDFKRIGIVG